MASQPSGEPPLEDVLAALARREPIFHRPELGTTRADFEAQTATDFWEVGASGRAYTREAVWEVVGARYADPSAAPDDPWDTSDFECRRIASDTYLLTYVLQQGARRTRRLTVWRRTDQGWMILYHQGTLAADDPA